MALREVVRIDEELCDGCGECVPSCAEGAIAIVDGKARLVDEALCDGLGACLGHCPQGAITIVRADAEPFDEALAHSVAAAAPAPRPPAQAPPLAAAHGHLQDGGGCPGSRTQQFAAADPVADGAPRPSALRHWPVQLHLISPAAPAYRGADVLLAADCVAYAAGDFHRDFLAGRALAIACPKLDSQQDAYVAKLAALIDGAEIRSLTVAIMEVPCCGGLVRLAQVAAAQARRSVPIRVVVVGVQGQVLVEQELPPAQPAAARPSLPSLG
jgi:Pyruvate/2-oxoacid:ferredoxin oxidoreductase delta subunit